MSETDEGISVSPAEMERMGAQLLEPAALVRDTFNTNKSEVEALGEPWGQEGDIAKAARTNLVPKLETFDGIGDALVKAFQHTAAETIKSAKIFRDSDDEGIDMSYDLNQEIGNNAGGGDGSGGSNRRG